MKLEEQLLTRSGTGCELCKSTGTLSLYEVSPAKYTDADHCIMICNKCVAQIEKREELDSNHWHCLSESMWSEVPAIQVIAWRMLNRLRNESWAMDNLDLLYLDDDKLTWAKAAGDHERSEERRVGKECRL